MREFALQFLHDILLLRVMLAKLALVPDSNQLRPQIDGVPHADLCVSQPLSGIPVGICLGWQNGGFVLESSFQDCSKVHQKMAPGADTNVLFCLETA